MNTDMNNKTLNSNMSSKRVKNLILKSIPLSLGVVGIGLAMSACATANSPYQPLKGLPVGKDDTKTQCVSFEPFSIDHTEQFSIRYSDFGTSSDQENYTLTIHKGSDCSSKAVLNTLSMPAYAYEEATIGGLINEHLVLAFPMESDRFSTFAIFNIKTGHKTFAPNAIQWQGQFFRETEDGYFYYYEPLHVELKQDTHCSHGQKKATEFKSWFSDGSPKFLAVNRGLDIHDENTFTPWDDDDYTVCYSELSALKGF